MTTQKDAGFEHEEDFGKGWDSDEEEQDTSPPKGEGASEGDAEQNLAEESQNDNAGEPDGQEGESDDTGQDDLDDDLELTKLLEQEEEDSYKKRYADTRAWAEKRDKEYKAEKQELQSKLNETLAQLQELQKTNSSREIEEMDFDELFDEDVTELFDSFS